MTTQSKDPGHDRDGAPPSPSARADSRRFAFSGRCRHHEIPIPRLSWRRQGDRRRVGAVGMASAVAKLLDELRDRGALKGTDVANIAAVSQATVSRWVSGKASPQPKTQLLISDLRYVVDRLADFYSPDETRMWLYSKHRLLNGERAIDLIHAGRADEVLAVIESLDEATYT